MVYRQTPANISYLVRTAIIVFAMVAAVQYYHQDITHVLLIGIFYAAMHAGAVLLDILFMLIQVEDHLRYREEGPP